MVEYVVGDTIMDPKTNQEIHFLNYVLFKQGFC